MFNELVKLFLLFTIYSVIGYICEVIVVTLSEKKFSPQRGFLIGPYIPIYGFGAICMAKLLSNYKNDLIILFVMSTVICTVLEYMTSYILEKIFKLRWWDYSHLSFNINGRVCLSNSILFGVGGIVITNYINPFLENILNNTTNIVLIISTSLIFLVILTDFIISLTALFNIKLEIKNYNKKDATETIKNEIAEFLTKHTIMRKQINRILSSFPNAKSHKEFNLPDYKELVQKIKNELKEKITKEK